MNKTNKLRSKGIDCLIIGLIFALNACVQLDRAEVPDVSDITVELEIRRFEQDLFQADTNQLLAELQTLKTQYPLFSELYFAEILGAKGSPEENVRYIKGFLSFPEVQDLYQACMDQYADFSEVKAEMEQAFRYYKYYFPEKATPQLTTYLSEYSIGAFIYGEDQLAVGLDFFLGADYPYAKYNPGNPNFSNYLIRTFDRKHMPVKIFKPLLEDLTGAPPGDKMLDIMLTKGKQLYLLDILFPETPDSVKLDLQQKEVDWLENNELEIWAYLLKEKLLYDSQWTNIRKFVEYSPNVSQMHPEAPGRTANWMGWQIVKAYMKKNPERDVQDLLAQRDSQEILNRSRYKPPR